LSITQLGQKLLEQKLPRAAATTTYYSQAQNATKGFLTEKVGLDIFQLSRIIIFKRCNYFALVVIFTTD
jgi:hypothetical protein